MARNIPVTRVDNAAFWRYYARPELHHRRWAGKQGNDAAFRRLNPN
jgi:hypothetical protein